MTTDSMWVEASRNVEAEAGERRFAVAKVAVADVWPVLAAARSEAEYALRQERVLDAIGARIASVLGEGLVEAVLPDVLDSLAADWATHHAARTATERAEREALAAVQAALQATAAKPAPRVAGEGAYVTDPHNSGVRKDVPAGTKATPGSAFSTMFGTQYDWTVEGLDGEWLLSSKGWTEAKESARKTATVDLSNIKIVDRGAGTFSGTTASGETVTFKPSAKDAEALRSVMLSDLAINFSGVTIDESEIVKDATRTAARHTDGSGQFKAQVAGVGDQVWSQNSVSFDTEEEAKAYASDLLGRWFGADLARVVPVDTPNREPVDPADPAIVINYRTAARTASRTEGEQRDPFARDAAEKGLDESKRDHRGTLEKTAAHAMRKGAPFAGYEDFDACVKANSDKDDPEAYCGKIKHQVEDGKTAAAAPTPPEVGWGQPYTGSPAYFTDESKKTLVWLFRNGQRVRFYDQHGNQVGDEQANVAPAVAYASDQHWLDYEGWKDFTAARRDGGGDGSAVAEEIGKFQQRARQTCTICGGKAHPLMHGHLDADKNDHEFKTGTRHTAAMSREQVKAWLLDYAWSGTREEQAREVECILAQDGWKHIDAVADAFAGAQESPGPAAMDAGTQFALSALYEAHDGPHLPTCPSAKKTGARKTARVLDQETLRSIRSQDPDGQATEPTDADRASFREFVIRQYGKDAWEQYTGDWDQKESALANLTDTEVLEAEAILAAWDGPTRTRMTEHAKGLDEATLLDIARTHATGGGDPAWQEIVAAEMDRRGLAKQAWTNPFTRRIPKPEVEPLQPNDRAEQIADALHQVNRDIDRSYQDDKPPSPAHARTAAEKGLDPAAHDLRCNACTATFESGEMVEGVAVEAGDRCYDCHRGTLARIERTAGLRVACRKCTAGHDPSGGRCDYCDGLGSLDATLAMVKAADGWDQGLTAQAFARTAEKAVKAISITPAGTGRAAGTEIREITVSGLDDMQRVVQGLIEPVDLSDGVTMYVNEEGLYQFGNEDVNWVAGDVAALGGRPEFMLRAPLKGPVLLVGFDPATGENADVPEIAMRWCQRVGREAGAKFAALVRTAATCEDCDGTGKVPAGGWEPPEKVTEGYVDCPTCGGTGTTGKEAVNTDAFGSDRYQRTPSPATPGWAHDGYDHGPGAGEGNPVIPQAERPAGQRAIDRQRRIFDENGLATARTGGLRTQANPYNPTTNPYATAGPGKPGSDFEPTLRSQHDDRGDFERRDRDMLPQTTRPRVKPHRTGPQMRTPEDSAFDNPDAGGLDLGTDRRTSPATDSASTAFARLRQAREQFTQPPTFQARVAAKVEEIAAGVLATNTGMTREAALHTAVETIRRYPGVIGKTLSRDWPEHLPKKPDHEHPVPDMNTALEDYLNQMRRSQGKPPNMRVVEN